jgi:hypothetical protein
MTDELITLENEVMPILTDSAFEAASPRERRAAPSLVEAEP